MGEEQYQEVLHLVQEIAKKVLIADKSVSTRQAEELSDEIAESVDKALRQEEPMHDWLG